MLTIQNLSYIHPNGDPLFQNLYLSAERGSKIALIGNNGAGKSTLLKLAAGQLQPSGGSVITSQPPYYIPQIFGQFNHLSVAEALGADQKLEALRQILAGNVSAHNYDLLNDDWTIEDRCLDALVYWRLGKIDFSQKLGSLSGGQKTKIFLAGIQIHQPELILLDEPSNHLDVSGRQILYDFIEKTDKTLIIISHDRKLLNLPDVICELTQNEIRTYGGNFDFYTEQKRVEREALTRRIQEKEKTFRKAREKERDTVERQHKSDARAKKSVGNAGLPKIVANTWKNNAEKSTARAAEIHSEKTQRLHEELHRLRSSEPETDRMKFEFDDSLLHRGKNLFVAENINFRYGEKKEVLWDKNLNIHIVSGERIAVKGRNGSGKTTLIRLILGILTPHCGKIDIAETTAIYIDQDYSLIDEQLTVYEQAQSFNIAGLQEHEVKIRLDRFLFSREEWDKACRALSGGEKMRLMLCCLNIRRKAPDLIILDEPTNNLDLQNVEILTEAIRDYRGTLIDVSHAD